MIALPGKVTKRCTDCQRPMIARTTRSPHRDVVRQSGAQGQLHRCQTCAWKHGYASPPPRPIQPRYCTCTGDVPPPDPNGMCPDCCRLVETCCRCGQ